MGGRTAVAAVCALWAGLLAAAALSAAPETLVLAAAAGALAGALFMIAAVRSPDRTGTLALLLALVFAGLARGAAHRAVLEHARRAAARAGELVRIEARIVAPPLAESGEPFAIMTLERAPFAFPARTQARLRLPAGSDAEWGDRIEALARLELPQGATVPGGFAARDAADAAALAVTGRAFFAHTLRARGVWAVPRATAARWRRALERCFAARLTAPTRELVAPLVLGDRSAMSSDLDWSLRASGLVHLLALSGLHVVWLAALARGLCATLGGGVRARAAAGAACAVFYVALAGPLPSLMRAAAGETLAAAAGWREQALDPLQSLALGAAVLLAAAPGWGGDLGFQLSCAATLGLVTLGPWLATRLSPAPPGALTRRTLVGLARRTLVGLGRTVSGLAGPTLAAQTLALPLLLARFHAISWMGLLANLLAVPISGLLLTAAWLGALADLCAPGAGRLLLDACEPLAAALRVIASVAAAAPHAFIATGADRALVVCATIAAASLPFALRAPRTLDERWQAGSWFRFWCGGCGALALALALLLAATAQPLRPPPGRWWMVVLDVGQGDAIALGFDSGWWLIDAGARTPQFDAGERAVMPFLRFGGVRRLEAIVLTHDDGDHTGGAHAVLRGVEVSEVWAPPVLARVRGPGPRFHAHAAARGDTLRRDPPLAVLWPPRASDPAAREIATDNRAALVLEVGEGAARALLNADADSTVEESLRVWLPVTVLKVGHHGSGSSSGARWLARVRPGIAAVSCGRHNPFGHPDAAALARLGAAGAAIHRTDREGTLWFEFGGNGVRLLDWRADAPRREAAAAAEALAAARQLTVSRAGTRADAALTLRGLPRFAAGW